MKSDTYDLLAKMLMRYNMTHGLLYDSRISLSMFAQFINCP
jgi:hypothetical protein